MVDRVLASQEAVLTTDAAADARFSSQRSVHALRLKSVLAVPISTPDRLLGVVYVDSRVQRSRFTESERELLVALSDPIAVALANARLHSELEQRSRELEEQKRTVERLSAQKDRELRTLREEPPSRGARSSCATTTRRSSGADRRCARCSSSSIA